MARKSKAHAARKKASQSDLPEAPMFLRIVWVTMAAVLIFLVVSLATFDSADAPSYVVAVHNQPAANLCGAFGAIVAYWAYTVIGSGSWILLAGIAGLLGVTVTGRMVTHPVVRGVGVVFMAIAVSCLHRLIFPHSGPLAGAHAGIFAEAIVIEMVPRFSFFGSLLLLLMSFCIGAVVAVDRLALAVPRFFFKTVLASRGLRMPSMNWLPSFERTKPVKEKKPKKSRKRVVDIEASIDPDAGGVGAIDSFDPEEYEVVDDEMEDEEQDETHLPQKLTPAELREKIAKLPVRIGASCATIARDEDIPREDNFEGYQFPTLELLVNPEINFSKKMETYVRQQAQSLEESLQTYGIDGEVAGIESGPTVTLYSIQLSPGTKVSKISAISSDLARSLKTQNVRIVPNMVGRSTIGIEVPNLKREKVRLKELMSGGDAAGMGLPMFLGKDAAGDPLVADLTKMPHMLIAGTTGSGKSVCMNSIIMSWIYTKRPDELKLVLVDPKMVELSQFANIPHLMCPVVTETPRAAAILEWAVTKMEERYELLREAMVQNVASYNQLTEEELYERFEAESDLEKAKIPKRLPYMVFVVDELADLMMASNDVEHSIVRIAQKARAVGIHLILATQRPQANVVTGLIKSNMPCRISFKVASGMDSRIVLDQKGAELLLGQGDMLFLSPHSTDLRRAQGTLVELPEIRKVMKFVKEIAAPNFERSLMAIRPEQSSSEDPMTTGERDPLFDQSVEVMIESGRGSVSLLQRRLAIGYSRASRLVDQMAQAGILGTHKGSVAREVLITIEDWAQMREMEERADTYGKITGEESQELGEASFDDGPVPAEIGNEYKM